MKRNQLTIIAAALLVLCSCSGKLGEMSSNYFAVTPQVLETVNGEVPVTVSGTFPAKYFPKKAVITATPVIKWEGGSVKGADGARLKGRTTKVSEEYNILKESLSNFFQTKVQLTCSDKGKGKIVIPFANEREMEKIIEILDRLK